MIASKKLTGDSMKEKLMQWPTAFLCGLGVFLVMPSAWAQAPAAADIMSEMRGFMADAVELVSWIILILSFLVAAWLIIDGGLRIFNDREGGGKRFLLGAIVALVMLIFTSYLVSTGQGEIDNIRGA